MVNIVVKQFCIRILGKIMSHGLVPSRSTVYVSNLPFSLTNNDLHKIFEKHGKIVKVTILKDKETRQSKGVAFILFLKEKDAKSCAESFDGKQLNGRTIRAHIAIDNGRSSEFIRKRTYENKSKCYECGEEGHLSYECSKNTLGKRKIPVKKKKRTSFKAHNSSTRSTKYETVDESVQDHSEEEDPRMETLSAAIKMEADKSYSKSKEPIAPKKKKIRKSSYFSDEEEFSD